mmetsp:Transcript_31349/g.82173  ORF Transcript_31349/g.82173 Transcript_31349/m.82173 type:complete len:81 (+) Transcript_31349:1327-1569(+)
MRQTEKESKKDLYIAPIRSGGAHYYSEYPGGGSSPGATSAPTARGAHVSARCGELKVATGATALWVVVVAMAALSPVPGG